MKPQLSDLQEESPGLQSSRARDRCGVPYALDESVLTIDGELLRTLLADVGCVGLVLKVRCRNRDSPPHSPPLHCHRHCHRHRHRHHPSRALACACPRLPARPPLSPVEVALNLACALAAQPTLLGGIEKTMTLAALAEEHGKLAVLTSAFESGVTHTFLSLVAAALPGASVAHGLSTFERLERDAFQPPFADHVRADLVDVRAAGLYLDAVAIQCAQRVPFAQSGGLCL